ncbi:MAG: hypothetical protein SNJ77_01605 [Cytophagales bacterium]
MTNKLITYLSFSILCASIAQAQVVTFSGYGRAQVDNNQLRDTSKAEIGKSTRGYTLFDLGIHAQPNEDFKASVILRLRNEFGGFFGNGAAFEFRQMKLEGILAKAVKYEIGDIDIAFTKNTLYNYDEIYRDYESEAFKIRRDIVNFENFYINNQWRVQGLNLASSFKFKKGIEKASIRTFGARVRQSNFFDSPDRFLYGVRAVVTQSKYAEIGLNYVGLSDIAGTSVDTAFRYTNNNYTSDFKFTLDSVGGLFKINLYGEAGASAFEGWQRNGRKEVYDDVMFDVAASATYNPLGIKLFAGYKNVGYQYTAPGAQSLRAYASSSPDLFPNYLGLGQAARPQLLFDRFTHERLGGTFNNTAVSPTMRAYLPQYGNISPYGNATPNRGGLYVGLSAEHPEKIFRADVKLEALRELVSEGDDSTFAKRSFTGFTAGGELQLGKLLKWNKQFAVSGSYRYENTQRGGINKVDFKTGLVDLGLNAEVYSKLFLLVGYKSLNANGKEQILGRDAFNNKLSGIPNLFDLNSKQDILCLGFKYEFNKNNFFNFQYNRVGYKEKDNSDNNLNLSQFYLVYITKF